MAYLEANKLNEGVIETPSGLQYKVVTEGTGANPVSIFEDPIDTPDAILVEAPSPVTGNANGPLGAYLVHNGLVEFASDKFHFKGFQGEKMGRKGERSISYQRS